MKNNNFIENPSKSQTITVVSIFVISTILLLLGASNFFTENPFKGKNFAIWIIFLPGLLTIIKIVKNYNKK